MLHKETEQSHISNAMSSKKSDKPKAAEPIHFPSKEFSSKARIPSMSAYKKLYKESIEKPDKFWAREAKELDWRKKWDKVLDWKAPFAKWFTGGKLNVCENCVDRHAKGARANKSIITHAAENKRQSIASISPRHRHKHGINRRAITACAIARLMADDDIVAVPVAHQMGAPRCEVDMIVFYALAGFSNLHSSLCKTSELPRKKGHECCGQMLRDKDRTVERVIQIPQYVLDCGNAARR